MLPVKWGLAEKILVWIRYLNHKWQGKKQTKQFSFETAPAILQFSVGATAGKSNWLGQLLRAKTRKGKHQKGL